MATIGTEQEFFIIQTSIYILFEVWQNFSFNFIYATQLQNAYNKYPLELLTFR